MFTDQEIQILSKFNSIYSFEMLSDIDRDIHNKMLLRFFSTYPKRTDLVVFDVGSNAGSFVKEFQNMASGHVHCFEPHPVFSKYLTDTYTNISINPYCISNESTIGNIYLPNLSAALGSTIYRPVFDKLLNTQTIVTKQVLFMPLDTYCKNKGIEEIDYLKIDVEGGEFKVLEGAKELLKNHKIKAGQFEGCPGSECLKEAGTSYEQVTNLLRSYDYNVEQICPNDCYFSI